jgi:hypothetical protein
MAQPVDGLENRMKFRRGTAATALVIGATMVTLGTAHADPAPAKPVIDYGVTMADKTVVTKLKGGTFQLVDKHGATPADKQQVIDIKDMAGNVAFEMPLDFRVAGLPIPVQPELADNNTTLKLTPVKPAGLDLGTTPVYAIPVAAAAGTQVGQPQPIAAQPQQPVGQPQQPVGQPQQSGGQPQPIAAQPQQPAGQPQQPAAQPKQPATQPQPVAKDIASPAENQAAMSDFATKFGIATAVGGFIGTALGAVIGCAVTFVAGCFPGLVTGAGVGGIIGTIVVGGPTLIAAGVDLLNTMQAAPGSTQWATTSSSSNTH